MDITLNANIVENTCQISVPDGGEVHLPTVGKNWFYNDDGSSRLAPTDAASGTLFSVKIDSCTAASDVKTEIYFSAAKSAMARCFSSGIY